MKKHVVKFLLGLSLIAAPTMAIAKDAGAPASRIAVVDFRKVIDESKYGQEGQNQLEAMRKQMATVVEGAEKELGDIANKLRDPEYLDSLSPDAEEELKMRYQGLSQEMMSQQQQFYQIMSQGEMRLIQELAMHTMRASQIIAKSHNLDLVLREDSCFFYTPGYDVTAPVVSEMDKLFAEEMGDAKSGDESKK